MKLAMSFCVSPRGTSWEPFGPRVGEACRAGKGGTQGASARPTSEGRGKKTRRGGARNCGELAYGDSSQGWRRPSKPWKNRPDHSRKWVRKRQIGRYRQKSRVLAWGREEAW